MRATTCWRPTRGPLPSEAATRSSSVSSDKDFAQVVGERIKMMLPPPTANPKLGWRRLDAAGVVRAVRGAAHARIADYLAIVGDTSDNIPGTRRAWGRRPPPSGSAEHGSLEERDRGRRQARAGGGYRPPVAASAGDLLRRQPQDPRRSTFRPAAAEQGSASMRRPRGNRGTLRHPGEDGRCGRRSLDGRRRASGTAGNTGIEPAPRPSTPFFETFFGSKM